MKILLYLALITISPQAFTQDGQGAGTSPGGNTPGETHVSPGGMGNHPSVRHENTHDEQGPKGKEAQEAAEEELFDISEEEQDQKQEGN